MRIDIYFHDYKDKSESNRTLEVLELFLSKHTIMKNYSSVYNSISFKFLNNAPMKREEKILMPYGIHPEVEIFSNFEDNRKLSVETFHLALGLIQETIPRIAYAPSKKEFDFDVEGLLGDISTAAKDAPHSKEALKHLDDNKKQLIIQNRMNHKLRIIENFRENPRPLDTKLIGVRVLGDRYRFNDDVDVYFYQNMYATIFSDVLRRYDIRLPSYKEIYIDLVNSLEEAIDISTSKEDWFQYTHAIFDYTRFKQSSQEMKEQLLLESLIEGLRYITNFDHLEKDKIESAIEYIQKHKLQTPLIYAFKENKEYNVTIQYRVTRETIIRNYVKAVYELHIFQKATGEERVIPLGVFETFNVPYVLGSISLTKKQVTIKGRTGLRAEIYRSSEKAPSEYKFQFDELFLTK
ncbi:hypothetical protein QNH20_10215 [Neobacillus sp. WH10]|uniref:hypothetical protein n=1 Tax=Neobacillus sp. WH10 TaxID=3047873 RepID=UPI0024C16D88|nr:hypothetical protein [Neobacillus sp. WH10]WHY79483.1 hypothetical protein QNH20_10215 [Neobacillus sp. WH10]